MITKFCDRCGMAEATHMVISDILRTPVCADCAAIARELPDLRVKKWHGHQAMPIELKEEQKVFGAPGQEFKMVVLTPFQRILATSVKKC